MTKTRVWNCCAQRGSFYSLRDDSEPFIPPCKSDEGRVATCKAGNPRLFIKSFSASVQAPADDFRSTERRSDVSLPCPAFSSTCEFELRGLSADSHLTIGYVQAVEKRHFHLSYTTGEAQWLFDGVRDRAMVSTCDGTYAPFVGSRAEAVTVRGDSALLSDGLSVSMTDRATTKASWRLPMKCTDSCSANVPELKRIERRQKFVTWLVVLDHRARTVTPILAVRWGFDMAVNVRRGKPPGQRVRWQPVRVSTPKLLKSPPPIPDSVLQAERTTSTSDTLIWSAKKRSEVVVLPRRTLTRRAVRARSTPVAISAPELPAYQTVRDPPPPYSAHAPNDTS